MIKDNFVSVVSYVFLVIGVLQALRLLNSWEAQIGSFVVPMWVSWVAVLFAFYLAFQGFRLTNKV